MKHLRYAAPVHLDPIKGQTVRCTRINVFPGNGTATYEFKAFDAEGKPAGAPFHTAAPVGGVLNALLNQAFASAQERLGNGEVVE